MHRVPKRRSASSGLHIHEFDYSILTLEGEGQVWLYFGAAGAARS